MAEDSTTVVTNQSWFSRMGKSFVGVLVGLGLFLGSFGLLWWNEGRTVKTTRALNEGAKAVVSVPADKVDSANEGRLVHVTGTAKTTDKLTDSFMSLSKTAIRLDREIEMYQWVESSKSETKEKIGGGTETTTTYSYSKEWSSSGKSSSSFKKPEGHQNPPMIYKSESVSATRATLGAFQLGPEQIGRITGEKPYPLADHDLAGLSPNLKSRAVIEQGVLYVGASAKANPMDPQIGDIKVSYEWIEPEVPVSLLSRQTGDSFSAYKTKNGIEIARLQTGTHSAEEMFAAAQSENKFLAWILRLAGVVAMGLGFSMILGPIRMLGALIPIVGKILGVGIGLISTLVAVALSSITIALAWIAYRPVLGISLLVVAGGAVALSIYLGAKKKKTA